MAIPDGCVTVLKRNPRLMRRQCRTSHAIPKQSSQPAAHLPMRAAFCRTANNREPRERIHHAGTSSRFDAPHPSTIPQAGSADEYLTKHRPAYTDIEYVSTAIRRPQQRSSNEHQLARYNCIHLNNVVPLHRRSVAVYPVDICHGCSNACYSYLLRYLIGPCFYLHRGSAYRASI
jgi:hypothetical protein